MNNPALNGVSAKSVPCSGSQIPCSQMISTNISPPRESADRKVESVPNVNARIRSSCSLNIGSFDRNSTTAKAISEAIPKPISISTWGLSHPVERFPYGLIPWVIAIMIRISPSAKVTFPSQSIRARTGRLSSCSIRYAQTVPNSPTGTEIRNTSRQLIGASIPPSTSPTNIPLTPTMLLIPSAIPRWLGGNASVRIAAELAIRKAPPTPWTRRKMTRYIAPEVPVSQHTVNASDAAV